MHSSLVRIQNVFGFFTTVVFSVGVLIALSVIVTPQTPKANLSMRNVQVYVPRPHPRDDGFSDGDHVLTVRLQCQGTAVLLQ